VKLINLENKEKAETLQRIITDLQERVNSGSIKAIGVFWQGTDDVAYYSSFARSKWELIGMIQQQIIYWTIHQHIENEQGAE